MPIPFNPPQLPLAYPENSLDKLNRTFELLNSYAEQRRKQHQEDTLLSLKVKEDALKGRQNFYEYGDPAGLTSTEQASLQPVQGPMQEGQSGHPLASYDPNNPAETFNSEFLNKFKEQFPQGIKGQTMTADPIIAPDGTIRYVPRSIKGKTLLEKTPSSTDTWTPAGVDAGGNFQVINKKGEVKPATSVGGGPAEKVYPKSANVPTAQARSTSEFAKTMIPHIAEMRNIVAEADKKGFIGPVAGRVYGKFLTGTIGSTGNPDADRLLGKLRSFNKLMNSGTVKVHFGSRGGLQMIDQFNSVLSSDRQSAAAINGSLDSIQSYMEGYAHAGELGGGNSPASQPAPHGQTVTQDGHTFTWNGTAYE